MRNKEFEGMVREALQLPNATVKNLGIIGGMTNLNYLVQVDEEEYIVRIPGHGTSSFINREQERQNLELGSAIGINPELVYFNVESGVKITRRIQGAKPLTEKITPLLLKKVAHIFQKLHQADTQMKQEFKLFTMIDEYESLARTARSPFYDEFEEVKADIQALQQQYSQAPTILTPCHIDPAPSNFLVNEKNDLYLIDWEYGGMFDPLWDIAAFSLEAELSKEQKTYFYQTYFTREVTKEEKQRLMMLTIFQDYLWSIWTLFKEESGDHFGLYGRRRFERAKENICQYKERYEPRSNAQ